MKKYFGLFCLFQLCTFLSHADHLVGGFLQMQQLDMFGKYRITLYLYMDTANWDLAPAPDYAAGYAQVEFFSKKNEERVMGVVLGESLDRPEDVIIQDVIYENRACADQRKLRHRLFIFKSEVRLNALDFKDPEGYYLVYHSCCRNYALSNVVEPGDYGTVLSIDLPALGTPDNTFIKFSSPSFSILNGDYICINRPFTYDMSATDSDGDELRYRMETPYYKPDNFLSVPRTKARAIWTNGSSDQAHIPGNPGLQINEKTGQLSLKANRIGLYVFGIAVDKIRDGKVLASSYHEFQLPVVDCFYATPPAPVVTYQDKPQSELSICPQDSALLKTADNPEWAFQWQYNGDNIVGANTATYWAKQPGSYAVVKSFKKTCSNDTISNAVSLKLANQRSSVKLSAPQLVFCQGDSLRLTAFSAQSSAFEWWLDNKPLGHTSATLSVQKQGLYKVKGKATANVCASLPDSLALQTQPAPLLAQAYNRLICTGDTAHFSTPNQAGVSYQWKLRNQLVATSAMVVAKDTGAYVLLASNALGCKATAGPFRLQYRPDCLPTSFHLFIPDAFTPNDDGQNDTWNIANIAQNPDAQVLVFNRWGEVIYESTGYDSPWNGQSNGRKVEAGGYAYQIHVPKINHTYRGRLLVVY